MDGLLYGDSGSVVCAPAENKGAGVVREAANTLRILHVVNRLSTGGTEYGVVKVIHGLGGSSFEHRICATRGCDEDLVNREGLRGRVILAGRQEAGFQFLVPRLARIMRTYRPHIVHSRNWGAIEAVLAGRLARVPVTIHSEHGYELDMLGGLPRHKRWMRRAIYSLADCIFTVSEQLREYHAAQAGICPDRIRVIPNGVDTTLFAPRPEERGEARRRLGLPADGFVVGSVGRMVAIKDHASLLSAAEMLVRRGVDIHVVLAGSGPELAGLQEKVEGSGELAGRVVFLGASHQIPSVLNAMDVFVLLSISEGMSNTLLEAMASGLAVVATRVGGNPELIEDNRSGWLFSPGDVPDLARRLERLAREPELRNHLGEMARRSAVEQFSLNGMISAYRELYLELARRRPASRSWEARRPCAA